MTVEGERLWQPGPEWIERANIIAYLRWLRQERGLEFADYDALWRWSVEHLDAFWESVWKYFQVESSAPYSAVLASREMPGAQWFPGARLNYAQLAAEVRKVATGLRELGVGSGDRVVAYLPNILEAAIALLATASVGAIWSSCSPDFGIRSVLDRFTQIEPKVLFCVDGYRYRGKPFHRKAELAEVIANLPSLQQVIYLPYLDPADESVPAANATLWRELVDRPSVPRDTFRFEQVPFGHPLWILFSSGTTGLPKAIVHSQGGIALEQLKLHSLHLDQKASERMFFFTTTGWMMWNFLVSSLLLGVTPVLYDGHPAHPQPDELWRIVDELEVTFFGASPTYVQMMEQAGVEPKSRFKLKALRSVMVAGSPVSAECNAWFYDNVKQDLLVTSGSGGTSAWTRRPSTTPGSRWWARSGSWSFASRYLPCPSSSGTTLAASATWTRFFRSIPVSGVTAISSRSMRAAAASCLVGRMRRSTALACASARPKSTAASNHCRR